MSDVTVISCLYGGRGYERFAGEWQHALRQLTTRPHETIVCADRDVKIADAHVYVTDCPWKHPQAWYLQRAVELATTEWVWIVDIDDQALPDALEGIDTVDADVWQMGYRTDSGTVHIPPQLSAAEVYHAARNEFTAGSAFRVTAFTRAGGFPDIAFQDWGLWRRMAATGATFETSGRAHYRYRRHPDTRTATDLAAVPRELHMAEMLESESAVAV